MSVFEQRSGVVIVPPARARALATVPFVELADGHLQGVVSSGSDVERVYVSSIRAGDHAFACSTNNNRPCGGARASMCKHLRALVQEAVLQYGAARVARYLRIDVPDRPGHGGQGLPVLNGAPSGAGTAAAAPVFARFLRHLAYLELPATTVAQPDMHWFAPTATEA